MKIFLSSLGAVSLDKQGPFVLSHYHSAPYMVLLDSISTLPIPICGYRTKAVPLLFVMVTYSQELPDL